MDDPTPEVMEEVATPKDLRAELFQDLSTRFTEALESDGSLPAAAQKALVEFLDLDALTAAQITEAVSKGDHEEKEAPNE